MKFLALTIGLLSCAVMSLPAETTPLTEALVEQKEITIACELTQAPRPFEAQVLNAGECERTLGTYHYKLWLPPGYLADTKKRWPCLFITSPNGKANMGKFAPWLKANGYIVVMLVESKNGPWEPIIGNFLAAHDDVVRRVRVQEGLKVATGFSGGARASSLFVQMRPGFSGLFLQGAGGASDAKGRYCVNGIGQNPSLYVAMAVGNLDKNNTEVARMKSIISPARFLSLSFDGGHAWVKPEVFEQAMQWIESRNGKKRY